MNNQSEVVSDQQCPIESVWVLKNSLYSLLSIIILIGYLIYIFRSDPIFSNLNYVGIDFHKLISLNTLESVGPFAFWVILIILGPWFHFISLTVMRANFHFEIEEQFFNLHQGWLKKQNRQLSYGVIQNVLVNRGLMDRLFGLSNLLIQNASTQSVVLQNPKFQMSQHAGFYGNTSNTISIPGLSKENAEIIKNTILQKVKDSPITDLGI